MRLIDADELWKKMYRYIDNEGAKMPYGDDDSLIHKDSACFLIENAPTIEPERIRGRWIPWDGDDCYECSACRGLWTFPDGTPEENGANFCPMCGADMREDSDG